MPQYTHAHSALHPPHAKSQLRNLIEVRIAYKLDMISLDKTSVASLGLSKLDHDRMWSILYLGDGVSKTNFTSKVKLISC